MISGLTTSTRASSNSMGPCLLARAVVTGNDDPEKRGRVQVSYPWMPAASSRLASDWARVASPFASERAGLVVIPKPDDEVLVYFENGNFDLPIIVGMLFSGKNPPPDRSSSGTGSGERPEEVVFLKTRGGHTVYFDDSERGAGISFQTSQGKKIDLSDSENRIELKDDAGNEIRMDEKGVQIRNASGDEVVLESGKIQIKSAGKIELGTGATEALLKGETFVNLFNAHVHPHPLGPTSPPSVPLQPPMVLSQKCKSE